MSKLILISCLILALFGCTITSIKKPKALFLENSQIVKEYEKGKKEISNPRIDNDISYCPVCEL